MAFLFFALANATLFVRPTEVVPDLVGLPIYNIMTVGCIALTYPKMMGQLRPSALAARPTSVCVLGLVACVALSHLGHGQPRYAVETSSEFAKVALYYFLLVSLLDTPARLQRFLTLVAGLVGLSASLALLSYHDMVTLHGVEHLDRLETNATTGEVYVIRQLQGSGIFGDPNDLCLILVVGIGIALYRLSGRRGGLFRLVWLAPLILFVNVLMMTYSRGGLLALLAGTMAYCACRFGARRAAAVGAVFLPLALVLVGGRQANIDTSTGSGQSRIQLWVASLITFVHEPVFGVGQGLLAETIGQESHNSFVHCFPDIGFVGGALFLGLYYNTFASLRRVGRHVARVADPELRRLHPFLAAIAVGYAAGMLTISRSYIVPTYMVPGLVAAYSRLATAGWGPPAERFDGRHALRLAGVSVAFLVALRLLLPLFTRWG